MFLRTRTKLRTFFKIWYYFFVFFERWKNSSSFGFIFRSLCQQKPNVLECAAGILFLSFIFFTVVFFLRLPTTSIYSPHPHFPFSSHSLSSLCEIINTLEKASPLMFYFFLEV